MAEIKFKWVCTTKSGKVVKESPKNRYNLDWEKEGVKKFEIKSTDGKYTYGIDFDNGVINLNGEERIDEDIKISKLKFFRRNIVNINAKGQPLASTVKYFICYINDKGTKAIRVNTDGTADIIDNL